VLRALASPNLDIRRKTLDIALHLLSRRNIDEVVLVLKKEVMKTQSSDASERGPEYRQARRSAWWLVVPARRLRACACAAAAATWHHHARPHPTPHARTQMLVAAIHSCAVKFPEVASSVVHLLMDFLGDPLVRRGARWQQAGACNHACCPHTHPCHTPVRPCTRTLTPTRAPHPQPLSNHTPTPPQVSSALDVVFFVREICETHPALRPSILERLRDTFGGIRASRVVSAQR
jgi:hypothetical protein